MYIGGGPVCVLTPERERSLVVCTVLCCAVLLYLDSGTLFLSLATQVLASYHSCWPGKIQIMNIIRPSSVLFVSLQIARLGFRERGRECVCVRGILACKEKGESPEETNEPLMLAVAQLKVKGTAADSTSHHAIPTELQLTVQ